MNLIQLIDKDGIDMGLYNCPPGVTVEQFRQALLDVDLDMDKFDSNNNIGAERIFVEEVYFPEKNRNYQNIGPGKPKMTIIVEKGEIVCVYSNTAIQYAIVDYDRKGGLENPVIGAFEAEELDCDIKEVFNPPESEVGKDSIAEYQRIYHALIKAGF